MAFFIEYDDTYVAGQHTASSISSLDSSPSLYTMDSCSSLCDPEDMNDLGFTQEQLKMIPHSIAIPSDAWTILPSFTQIQKEQDASRLKSIPSPDEKRAHHIAAEHKRRQSIRAGLKHLTDLVPHLKHPHRKSTVLFKTVDYIKRTEKRNKILQDRVRVLQQRLIQRWQQPLSYQCHGAAIIVPVDDPPSSSIPYLNIPADEDFGTEPLRRERFLSCGKLASLEIN